MNRQLKGLNGEDPLGFLAALGLLRIVAERTSEARLRWVQDGSWFAEMEAPDSCDLIGLVVEDLAKWRSGHGAVDFAINADRKAQDLKHPPEDFRRLMRQVATSPSAAAFIASFATGVATDGTGQTKPTSLHFTAGQQRFMAAVLDVRDKVSRDDFENCLSAPCAGRTDVKGLRWRAASERERALLGFDPSNEKSPTDAGATWLAFQAMPLFPVVPVQRRAVTTGFRGGGKHEHFAWPIWSIPLSLDSVRVLVGTNELVATSSEWRTARGVAQVFESSVVRSSQGYGNFAAPNPI